jgi:hypothetical protein
MIRKDGGESEMYLGIIQLLVPWFQHTLSRVGLGFVQTKDIVVIDPRVE